MKGGLLRVGVPGGGEVEMRVWDMLGRRVWGERVEVRGGGFVERDLRRVLGQGVYTVEVVWGDQVDRGRIVAP